MKLLCQDTVLPMMCSTHVLAAACRFAKYGVHMTDLDKRGAMLVD
jgi:hypothetical protein